MINISRSFTPAGILSERDPGISHYVPNLDALLQVYAAIYELLGEPVRVLLPPHICAGNEALVAAADYEP
jgi:hypothetical protein